jgi:hypothetical protein
MKGNKKYSPSYMFGNREGMRKRKEKNTWFAKGREMKRKKLYFLLLMS